MSRFEVSPEQVFEATRPMHGIGGAIADAHSQIGAHADAAAGTGGAGHVQSVFAVWSDALPNYAQAAERMITSMTLSSAGYQRVDDDIAGQTTPGAN